MHSKLAAVLIADIAGYGRLMEASERGTHARLMGLRRDVIDRTLGLHAGHIIKRTGDGFIAIFETVRNAKLAFSLSRVLGQKEIALTFPTTFRCRSRPSSRISRCSPPASFDQNACRMHDFQFDP